MKYFKYLKKYNPEKLKKISSKAGKSVKYETRIKAYQGYKMWEDSLTKRERYELRRKKGISTQTKYPTLSSKTLKKTHKKWKKNKSDEYSKRQSAAGKKGGKVRAKQLKGNIQYFSTIGKISQKKHPKRVSKQMKKFHNEWKKRDPAGYSLHQSKAMLAVKKPTNPEKIMKQLLPQDFLFDKPFKFGVPDFRSIKRKIIIQVDGPRHYKTMGPSYDVNRLNKAKLKDKKQTKIWNELGYKVYRFKDIDLIKKNR